MEKKLNTILAAMCEKTGASEEGIRKLVDYYIKGCGWTEDRAVEYVYELFENGTIAAIMTIGK